MAKNKEFNYNYNYNCDIDYDKLAMSIIKAHDLMTENAEKEELKKLEEWQKIIGYKKAPKDLSSKRQRSYEIRNNFTVFFRLLFRVNREDIKTSIINNGLMKMFISFAYSILEYLLYLVTFVFFLIFIFNVSLESLAFCFSLGFVSLVFARIFRIASIEVEKIRDNNYLVGLFSAITSFIAMVATIIALFKTNM